MASSSTVHVRHPIGISWLILNWPMVLGCGLLSLFPLYFFIQRWRRSEQRARSLFDYTLAESMRKKGEAKASIAQFDKILQHQQCPQQLLWVSDTHYSFASHDRCHSGRSQALLASGDAVQALLAANTALELARIHQDEAAKRQAKTDAAATAKGDAAATAASSSAASSPLSDPDVDPFLSLPSISLSHLFYNRGLVYESLPGQMNRESAMSDFAAAAEMDPSLDFAVGQRAREEMKRRLQQIRMQKEQQESKEGVEGKSNDDEEESTAAAAAQASSPSTLQQRTAASSSASKASGKNK